MTFLMGRYLQHRSHRVLVLGCGDGWLERSLAPLWFIESIDAFDVAAGAVERARAEAARLGIDKIRYGVRDLNADRVPAGPYELIIAHSVVHHIENLELFYESLHASLADDGLLLINEYVGPKRFQFTDRQMEIMNDLLPAIPERLRKAKLGPGTYDRKARPTVEEMIASDPSEAVRSDEILAFTDRHFLVLDRFDCGGTILHHLLYDIVQNFRGDAAAESSILRLLCLAEEALIRRGGLASDFQVLAAAKSKLVPALPAPRQDDYDNQEPITPEPSGILRSGLKLVRRRHPLLAPFGAHIRPMREEQNRRLTGRAEADWIQYALEATGGDNLRALVVGKGANALADRLRANPAIRDVDAAMQPSVGARYDIVFGLGAMNDHGSAEALAASVGDSGALACLERVRAEAAPGWLLHLVTALAESLPESWQKRTGFASRVRQRRALEARDGIDIAGLTGRLQNAFASVATHSMSSRISEYLLAVRELPTDPSDDAEAGLLRLLVAIEHRLMHEGVLPPSMALVLARR